MSSKVKNWLLVFVWAGLIFFLSNQPYLKSDLPNQWDFILRKIAHITEYAILAWLLIRALQGNKLTWGQLTLAVVLSILYAVSDEYHQTFVLGREGTFRDVSIDSFGVLLAAWLNRRKMIVKD